MCLLFEKPTKICVTIALLYLLPTPLLSDLSFYSYPVFCICLLCLMLGGGLRLGGLV